MSRIVARCNGLEIVDRGDEAWVVTKDVPSPVWLMVAALLACVTLGNGTLQVMYGFAKSDRQHGFLGVGLLLLGFVFVRLGMRFNRARNEAQEAPGKPWLIFAEGALRDAERRELAPLESIRWARTFQLASSSRALTLTWPAGSLVLARGNPFGDSVDEFVDALESLGVRSA
jgi:hypothetical protein